MEDFLKQLKQMKAKRIFIQYPEGLKTKIKEIGKQLEKEGFETVICCEPVFGACDIRDIEAKRLECDAILHIAHTDFGLKSDLPVVYWDYFFDVDPIPILKKEFKKIENYNTIGIFTSLQYMSAMKKVKEFLESKGKKVLVEKSEKYEGQVLGCRIQVAIKLKDKVDCFLYVGAGKFHPLGVALSTDLPVFSLDLEKNEILNLENEKMKYLKKKAWHDEELKNAKTVALIVSWKKGQNRIKEAFELKKELERKGKEVYILALDAYSKDKIIGMKFDAIVSMLCPRMDDEIL